MVSKQLHGFSDASEDAYSAVGYLRMVDTHENVHISLVMSKTKFPNKAADHSAFGTVWCFTTVLVALPHQRSVWNINEQC